MYLKGIHNREFNCSGKQNSFHGPNIKGKMLKKRRNLKQHKCSKCLRVARQSRGACSVSLFVPRTGSNFASWFSFKLQLLHSLFNTLGSHLHATKLLVLEKQSPPPLVWCTNMSEELRYVSVQVAR